MRARILCVTAAIGLLPVIASAQDGLRSASLPERPLTSTLAPARDLFRVEPDAYTTLRADRPIYALPYVFPYVYALPYVFPYVYPFPYVFPDGYWYLDSLVLPGPLRPSTDAGRPDFVDGRRTRPTYGGYTGTRYVERVPQRRPAEHRERVPRPSTSSGRPEHVEGRSGPAGTPAAAAPGAPKTFYVIAGCYAGDTPPRPAWLPSDCDPSNVRVIPP